MGWTVWTPHGKTGLYFFYIYCHCLYGIQKTISGFPSQNLGTQIREGGRELAKYFLNEWKNILLSMLPPYPKWMCCSNSKQVPPLPWVPLSPLLPVCASCPSLALQFICSHTPFSQLAYSAWMPHNSSSFLLSRFNWNIALIPLQSNSAYPVSSCPSTLNLLGMSVLSSPYMSLYYASCFHSRDVSKWQKEPWVLFLCLPPKCMWFHT